MERKIIYLLYFYPAFQRWNGGKNNGEMVRFCTSGRVFEKDEDDLQKPFLCIYGKDFLFLLLSQDALAETWNSF